MGAGSAGIPRAAPETRTDYRQTAVSVHSAPAKRGFTEVRKPREQPFFGLVKRPVNQRVCLPRYLV